MTDHPHASAAERLLAALATGDADLLPEDAVWHEPGTNGFSGKFQGKAAIASRLERMRGAGVSHGFEIHDVLGNDEHAVALVHAHMENEKSESYDGPQVIVMHVRDGEPKEFWVTNQDQAVVDLILGP